MGAVSGHTAFFSVSLLLAAAFLPAGLPKAPRLWARLRGEGAESQLCFSIITRFITSSDIDGVLVGNEIHIRNKLFRNRRRKKKAKNPAFTM